MEIGTFVVVRDHRAGVHFGRLASPATDPVVVLTEARHAWSWPGALSAASLATCGPSGGRISATVESVVLRDPIAVYAASETASAAWAAAPVDG